MTGDHLYDDALSASLDGEAAPAESAHVESCAECRARADELRAAANAIGAPLPAVDGAARDEAIRVALLSLPTHLESRRTRWQPPTWAWGAAAAVLIVAVLVPVLGRNDKDATNTAASGRQEKTQRSAADSSAGASTLSAPASPIDAGDLGSVDGSQLQAAVATALGGPAAATAAPSNPYAYDQAPTTMAAASPPPPCIDELRTAQPDLGALRLVARAKLDGRPVHVLVFEVPGEHPQLRLVVAALDGCALIRSEALP
jgi:anti-sigma factor RsiW